MNIGIFPPHRVLPRFRMYYFIHRAGAAMFCNGTFDEGIRPLTEKELNFINQTNDKAKAQNDREKNKRKHIALIPVEPVKVFGEFRFEKTSYFRTRKFRKALRQAKKLGATVGKYEVYVPQGI